jgi:hypothetical protein
MAQSQVGAVHSLIRLPIGTIIPALRQTALDARPT